jgi:hypothetical protein
VRSSSLEHQHCGGKAMKRFLVTLSASVGLFVWANMTMAQSWIPYIMGPGQQVLNMATRPRPAAAPTAAIPDGGYGAMVGQRRLVCQQWTGNRWVLVNVSAKQCVR